MPTLRPLSTSPFRSCRQGPGVGAADQKTEVGGRGLIMKMAIVGPIASAVAVASIATIVSCAAPTGTWDGQYVGTPIATDAIAERDWPLGRQGSPCSQHLTPLTLEVVNGNATLVVNRRTNLVFSGPVGEGGAVAIPGRSDFGGRGMALNGAIANGQFDGRTAGLACNAEMHLKRIGPVLYGTLPVAVGGPSPVHTIKTESTAAKANGLSSLLF